MKKSKLKHQYLIGLVFTILACIVFIQAMDTAGLVRAASANQALIASSIKLPGEKLDLVAFSPDGKTLASADPDGQIMLWDVASGQARMALPSQFASPVNGIIFSPDGNTLASVSDGSIRLWDVASGEVRSSLPVSTLVTDLVFSPDSKTLAAVGQDARITLWESQSGSMTQVLTGHKSGVNALAFSPDSKILASGGQDAQIKLWDRETGRKQASLTGSGGAAVTDLAFSPDGKILATVGKNARITLWDSQSGSKIEVLTGHKSGVNALAFSPDSTILATGDQDAQIKLWDMKTGLEQANLPGDAGAAITDLIFSPDGKILASASESEPVFLWDVSSKLPQLLTGHRDWVVKIVFSAYQKNLASVGKTGQVVVWNLMTGQEQLAFQIPLSGSPVASPQGSASANSITNTAKVDEVVLALTNGNGKAVKEKALGQSTESPKKKRSKHDWKGVTALAINPDGTLFGGTTKDGKVRLWAANGKERFAISEHHGAAITGVVFSADGKRLISVGRDTEVQIRDVAKGKKGQTLLAHETPIRAVAASPDGKFLASAGEETRVMLWDAKTGKLLKILTGQTDFINAVSFSADGKHLASAGANGRILLWDVVTGKLVKTLLGHSNEVNAVAFSKDGKFLASGSADSLVILWDAATGQQLQSFAGHQAAVRTVAFSPNGQRLLSAGEDTRILVWDTSTHKLVKQMAGTTNVISALVFGPSGNLIAGSEDGEITEWDVEKGQKKQIITVPLQPQSTNSEAIPAVSSIESTKAVPAGAGQFNQLISTQLAAVTQPDIFNRVLNWLIPAAEAAIPSPPGGPILVVTTTADPFGQYYTEILRTEGFNEFAVADITTVTDASSLAAYDVVILASTALTGMQVTLFANWVDAGGNLIAMKPDKQLAGLLGLTDANTTLPNGYLLVDTTVLPGNGIVGQTIQFHGTADRYTLNGATSIATLYNTATTASSNPAVAIKNVGANGGQAAAFTYDLATSIVYTRQGNPSWAAQERDGYPPIRSDDKFYGNASGDPQPDWVDLNKVAIPQADEQQRLLANLIIEMSRDKKPLPRFWYFPNGKKAVVIMTGDDHGNNGTGPRFDQFKALSPAGCNVANWECVRGTSYMFTNTPLTDAQVAGYTADGFEVGLHINTNCADYTPASLEAFYAQQLVDFHTNYPSIPAPITQRHHCIAWSDWVTGASVQSNHGIRLDTSYYFWPPGWVGNQPGIFTGSAMPMRFSDLDGKLVDVYNVATQMTDESGQQYPFTINTLLDRALGDEGYYGAYTVNAHTDVPEIPEATEVVISAQARGVPVVSSVQMLNWLDARNASSFGGLTWDSNNSSLSFAVTPDAGANGLLAMVPTSSANGLTLTTLTRSGSNVTYTTDTIKGIEYAFFPAVAGSYVATYGADTIPPTVLSTSPTNGATGVNLTGVTAIFSKGMNALTISGASFELRNANNALVPAIVAYNPGSRTATLTPSAQLSAQSSYTVKIKGGAGGVTDVAGNALAADYTWTFETGTGGANSAWSGSSTPANPSDNDSGSVELGVKFKVDINGFITGIRFYKGAGNTGTHIGNLWNTSGTNLATATFTNETASGWQQVNFPAPVAVTAGTVYVASYFAPNGHYAADSLFFANAGLDNAPLHLLKDGVSGGNGVYAYSAGSTFPAQTYRSTNYWVDVAFTANADPAPLTVTSTTPSSNATGVIPGGEGSQLALNVFFNKAIDPATINGATFILKDTNNTVVSASYDATGNSARLTPSAPLAYFTTYTASLTTEVKDADGNAIGAPYTWTFSTASGSGGCLSPPNSIIAENCQTGNPSSEWDVSGAGDTSIQGFATDISVNHGGTVSFKIKTDASNYHMDIYRLGYYGGLGARKVATVNPSANLPQTQPDCQNDAATGLIDCGNWAVSASWTVPADATSGIYFAKVVRTDTGGASHIVFIVRDDTSTSDLLFQTSDTTWQAYNDYGGNSFYTGLPVGRAYKVSYNRPFNTRTVDNGQDWLFNSEYPMVRWLEANGYDVSYFTGIDSDRFGSLIRNHRVFLSNGHDEYWSSQQRTNVEAARDASVNPVNLAFFSGNEVFWKTRWENSIDGSDTAYRTLVCYKETHGFPINADPTDTWTGTWRDPRGTLPTDGGRPENALTGTIFMVNAGATTAITVPEADGKMRFWRNTSIATLAPGASATLADNTLGYEWDLDEDNGFRPSGLIGLSTTTVLNAPLLQDYGSTYGSGTATHKLTLYKHTSGARVFGAGTVQWAWGLDSNHDRGNNPVDLRIQQATLNLFADMNVLPALGQPGLIAASPSTDITAPASTITSPLAGANVTQDNPVIISGTAADTGGGVVGGVEVSIDNGSTWHPATGRGTWSYTWTPSSTGSVMIKSRAVDDSGNLASPGTGINVTVGSSSSACTGNTIWPTNPTPSVISDSDTSAVELGVKFKSTVDGTVCGIRFYKGSNNTGMHVGKLWSSTGTLLASVTFTGETGSGWQQMTFASPVAITANTVYLASYYAPVGRYSANGNYFSSGVTSGQLYAFSSAESGGNGVYRYGSGGGFPSSTYQAGNYWVDVVFIPGAAPTLSSLSVTPTSSTISTGGTQQFTATGTYSNGSTQDLTSQVTWASSSASVATIANGGLATGVGVGSATISATQGSVVGSTDLTVQATPLAITTATLPGGTVGAAYSATLAANGGSLPYTWSIISGTLPGDLNLDSATGVISGTPTAAGTLNFTVQVADSAASTITKALSITVTTASTTVTIWPGTTVPSLVDAGDGSAVELGVKFTSDVGGTISGIRFYKAAANTGTHVGTLWTSTGTQLAQATFTGESGSGWQQVNFTSPVSISAGTVYVASYHTNTGHYSATANNFASAVNSPPLHALASGTSGGNGLYLYGAGGFPTNTYNAANYWVDVVFSPGAAPTLSSLSVTPASPTISTGGTQQFTATGTYSNGSTQDQTSQVIWSSSSTSVAPIANSGLATGVGVGSATISATQGSVVGSTGLTVQATPLAITTSTLSGGTVGAAYSATLAANGGALPYSWSINSGSLPGGLSLNSSTGVISGTPTAAGTLNFTVQVADSAASTITKALSITVTTASTTVTIWPGTTVPSLVDAGDGSAVELGVKFTADVGGTISGIRFYKAAANTGTHVGTLWTSTGTQLAQATFTGESGSGWQQVNFASPVSITVGTVYVASYHTNAGHYSANVNNFASAVNSPPLHALASGASGGNGVYLYGTGGFPTNTYNAANYWVDVVFNQVP